MIEAAVKKLVEEGSLITAKLISEYIIQTYKGLPWAHESYLKHHLAIVCEKGELVADLDGSYILPGKERCSRKKLLKLKLRNRKQEVVEEGNVALEEVNELSDSQVGNQENASPKLGRGNRKRRRSYIFSDDEDDDDEVLETRMVVGEQNKGNGSKMVVTETQTEVLLLKGEEAECKSNEMDTRISEEVHGLVDVVTEKSKLQFDIGPNQVELDHNLSEVRKEPDLLVLPGNVPKIRPVVSEGEFMELDDSLGATLTLESVESVNESNLGIDGHRNCCGELMLSSVIVDPLAIVSKIESDAFGLMVDKSVAEGRKSVPSASELMIVPYEENSRNSAQGKVMIPLSIIIDPVIVCGLPNELSEQPKKKLKVYPKSRRKRSKPEEESILASLDSRLRQRVETKIKQKSQSPRSKTTTPFEDSSVKQLQRQNSSHPISSLKIISIEDEEPLRQVIEKCNNLKKHGMQGAMMKVASPLASSKADVQSPMKLPSSENLVATIPTVGEESAFTKRTEKQTYVQLSSHDKSCDYVHENVSRKSSSLEHDCPSKEVASLESLDGSGDQPKQSQLEVSDHNSKAITVLGQTTENAPEGPELQCPEPFNSNEVFISPSLLEEHNQREEGPSEPRRHDASDNQHTKLETSRRADLSSHGIEDNKGQSLHVVRHQDLDTPVETLVNGNLPVAYQHPHQQNKDDRESPLKPIEAIPVDEAFQHSHQLSEQLKNSQQNKRGPGRPQKRNKRTLTEAKGSMNPQSGSMKPQPATCLISDHQNKKKSSVEGASDPSNLYLPEKEGTTLAIIQHSQQKNKMLKQDCRVRTRNQSATKKDPADQLDPNPKEQGLLSVTKTSQNLQNQNNPLKKSGRGRPPKSPKPIAPAPVAMDLTPLYWEELKLKQKEAVTEDRVIEPAARPQGSPKIKMNENEEHLSAPLNNQQSENKKLKTGMQPKIKKQEEKGDEAIMSLSYQEKGGVCASPYRQLRSNTRAESLEKGTTQSGAAVSNLCLEQGDLKSVLHAVPEASSKQNHVDLKEILPATIVQITPDLELSAVATPEASTCLAGKFRQRQKEQNQSIRRITRSSEAAKVLLESQNGKQHDLEPSEKSLAKPTPDLVPSDHHYPEEESDDLKKKVYGELVELERGKAPPDNKAYRQPQKQKQDQQDRTPSKPLTTLSNNQDQERHEKSHDQASEKMEVSKKIAARSASIRVPLSSKGQLRSRMKRQLHDSA